MRPLGVGPTRPALNPALPIHNNVKRPILSSILAQNTLSFNEIKVSLRCLIFIPKNSNSPESCLLIVRNTL